jgi:WD40 repeat protein
VDVREWESVGGVRKKCSPLALAKGTQHLKPLLPSSHALPPWLLSLSFPAVPYPPQIISLSSDKTIKIWDIRNHKCMVSVQDREQYKHEDTLLSMAFDPKRQVRGHLAAGSIWDSAGIS